jgi:hypothetical protein
MTFNKKVVYLAVLTSIAFSSAAPLHAQQRRNLTIPTYTPPPAPRPTARPVEPERPQPQPQPRNYQPKNQPPEERHPENPQPAYSHPVQQQEHTREVTTQPTNVGNSHISTGTALETHRGFTAVRPAVVTPAMTNAMRYNQVRPDGTWHWRLFPAYTAAVFGSSHTWHFANGFVVVGGESYFWLPGLNGAGRVWFGILGPFPDNWLLTDPLYLDFGDDGNYYLYDALYPGIAIPLSAGDNAGDDQTGDSE